jgi:hypothetical protein
MPFGVASPHQVIKFLVVDFQGKWLRTWPVRGVMYTAASSRAQLLVVTDNESGATVTYAFRVPNGEEVWIDRNIIHVPGHCYKQIDGNGIQCR